MLTKKSGRQFKQLEKQSSQQQSNRQSGSISKLTVLGNALMHQSNKSHKQIFQDPLLRSAFSIKQRVSDWVYNFFCCKNNENTYIDQIDQMQKNHPIQLPEDLLKDKIIQLKILQTSRLELDPNVIHPFVKIHFLDKRTGVYLKKSEKVQSVTYHFQANTYYNDGQKKYQACENDIILPLSTNCVDFRIEGNSRGVWNQKFYINQKAKDLLTPNTIILFQILDFNHQLLTKRDFSDLDKNYFYRIAWAFLRPIGIGKKHIGASKLQLYRYKTDSKKLSNQFTKSFIPSVYYEFIWNRHQKYEGYLSMQIVPVQAPAYKWTEQLQAPQNIFQIQKPDKQYIKKYEVKTNTSKTQTIIKQQNLLKYYRVKQCLIPQKLIYKFESSKLGCLRIIFSETLLFCCCSSNSFTKIKIFSLQNFENVITLKGHQDIIYSLSLSENQKYLLSVGSDFSSRLWLIPQYTGQIIDQQQSQAYLINQCIHPSYVYSGIIYQGSINNTLIVITGCYDGIVRIWKIDLEHPQHPQCLEINLNDQSSSNSIVYPTVITSGQGFFIVGDSMGAIHVFDIQIGIKNSCRKRCKLVDKQLKDDKINSINILNKSNILIQSRDNVIRQCQISTGQIKIIRSYFGAQCENYFIRSVLSPDKRFLLSGSEQGKPFMWNITTGQQINLDHLQLYIQGPITDCCWNKKFNLIAFSGFTQECPIFLYGNKIKDSDQQAILTILTKK